MDAVGEKIKKLQQNAESVRTGGKGTARRKKKVVHKTAATDDRKLQTHLKKLSVTTIPSIDEVNMICDDGSVIHLNTPKVQASIPSNTFLITGVAEKKPLSELTPQIINQLGANSFCQFQQLANLAQKNKNCDDGIPTLIGDINFEEVAKKDDRLDSRYTKPSIEQGEIDAVD